MVLAIIISLVAGFTSAWIIQLIRIQKISRELKSMGGILESEKLIKETLRKENAMAFQLKETSELELSAKLKEAQTTIKMMDEDILLLQKSNDETEDLLKATQPEVHQLKIKLIEANNAILRYKAKYGVLKN
jgi:hypothetical protein